MFRSTPKILGLAILAGGALTQGRALAASVQPFPLRSTSVELPAGDRAFPKGPGVEAVSTNCVTCHSAGMILNQPALSKTTWETEVHKMISVYKAPISNDDVAAIVGYLALNLKQ